MSDIDRFIIIRKYFTKKQNEFADLLEINQQGISDIERGRKKIPYEILGKIGKLGINLNWLLTGEGEMLTSGCDENALHEPRVEYGKYLTCYSESRCRNISIFRWIICLFRTFKRSIRQ